MAAVLSPRQDQVTGVHLVGSVPLPTAEEVFTQAARALPNRLKRLPDGEPSNRQYYVLFQRDLFSDIPQVLRQFDAAFKPVASPAPTESDLTTVKEFLAKAPLETGYDVAAVESYDTFKHLQAAGIVLPTTKFQVSLPTAINTMTLIAEGYQALIEPYYEDALIRASKKIQASIPHSDLSIQWDAASEFAMIEGVVGQHFDVWFKPPIKDAIMERLLRFVNSVSPEVDCGLHLCYGDIAHSHFCQPKDSGHLVDVARMTIEQAARRIDFVQLPVPKDRVDDAYFEPLRSLDLGDTELFLGLVHEGDLQGTKTRIETAKRTGKKFGVSTECGMGRMSAEWLQGVLEDSATVSSPYE